MRQARAAVQTPDETGVIHIDLSQIPEFRRNELADLALALTEKCFSRPGEEERYQAWLSSRKKSEAAPAAPGTTSSEISEIHIIKSACNSQARKEFK